MFFHFPSSSRPFSSFSFPSCGVPSSFLIFHSVPLVIPSLSFPVHSFVFPSLVLFSLLFPLSSLPFVVRLPFYSTGSGLKTIARTLLRLTRPRFADKPCHFCVYFILCCLRAIGTCNVLPDKTRKCNEYVALYSVFGFICIEAYRFRCLPASVESLVSQKVFYIQMYGQPLINEVCVGAAGGGKSE